MFIIDGHLDLAYNALVNGRNLQQPLNQLRAAEKGRHPSGIATMTLPALKEAGVGLVFGTIFTVPASRHSPEGYQSQMQAQQMGIAQLDYYHRLADEDETIRLVRTQAELAEIVNSFSAGNQPLLGIVLLLKGADPIHEPQTLEMWVERGLRIVGPAWDDTIYASSFQRDGRSGLSKQGHQLLEIMADFSLIADISYLSEKASLEVLDRYPGTIIASHSNARALVPNLNKRHLSDTQIQLIGERGGVIGVSPYNPFLRRGHRHGESKQLVSIHEMVAHIDHICQVLGNASHVGIGTGLDCLFGAADMPSGFDSVADFQAIGEALKLRGYEVEAVTAVLGQNWLSLLQRSLP